MIIELKGYLPDRLPHVLNAVCREKGFQAPMGVFTDFTFVADDDMEPPSQEVVDLISATFAPASKAYLIKQVNEFRVYHELGGFAYNGHSFESDRDSILRISNAALSAANNPEFSVFWNDSDNVPVQLDQASMLGMQAALVAHGEACFLHAQQLKAQIEAAETTADLAAIDLTEGWP